MRIKSSDNEIIESVLAGDQALFSELVKRHQSYVFTLAMRFVRKREEAEEVAQDTFVKAFRSLASFKKESKFTTWLYTISYHTAMTHLRKKKLVTTSIDEDNKSAQIENYNSYNELSAEKKSRSFYVNKAIESLRPDDATLITLFYHGEQTIDEISKIMNIESNGAKVKLHRARHRLKEKLELLLKEEVKELL